MNHLKYNIYYYGLYIYDNDDLWLYDIWLCSQDAEAVERLNESGELRSILKPFKVKSKDLYVSLICFHIRNVPSGADGNILSSDAIIIITHIHTYTTLNTTFLFRTRWFYNIKKFSPSLSIKHLLFSITHTIVIPITATNGKQTKIYINVSIICTPIHVYGMGYVNTWNLYNTKCFHFLRPQLRCYLVYNNVYIITKRPIQQIWFRMMDDKICHLRLNHTFKSWFYSLVLLSSFIVPCYNIVIIL